jgi:TPR repeat protein
MAQYNLGLCYLNGLEVEKDPLNALRYIKLAAAQNLVEAYVCGGRREEEEGGRREEGGGRREERGRRKEVGGGMRDEG